MTRWRWCAPSRRQTWRRPLGREHLKDLVDLLTTVRDDEAMAEYVYAIAPAWDGTIETLLLGGRVTTAFSRFTLESSGAELPAPRRGGSFRPGATARRRVPAPVG